jgi:hypothetical protein
VGFHLVTFAYLEIRPALYIFTVRV